MKREVVPTSPQYDRSEAEAPARGNGRRWLWLGAAVVGLVSGGLSSVTVAAWLALEYLSVPGLPSIVTVAEPEADLPSIISRHSPAMRDRTVTLLNRDLQLIGLGVWVTTDGWMVSTMDVPGDGTIISAGRESLSVLERVYDSYSDLYFYRLDRDDAPVVTLGKPPDQALGLGGVWLQLPAVQSDTAAFRRLASVMPNASDAHTSDRFLDWWLLDHTAEVVNGTPWVSLDGIVLGLRRPDGRVVPGDLIDRTLTDWLNTGSFRRLPFQLTVRSQSFALPAGQSGFVVKETSSEQLQNGDVILAVNDQTLSKTDNLIEILRSFDSGKSISLEIERNGKRQLIELTI